MKHRSEARHRSLLAKRGVKAWSRSATAKHDREMRGPVLFARNSPVEASRSMCIVGNPSPLCFVDAPPHSTTAMHNDDYTPPPLFVLFPPPPTCFRCSCPSSHLLPRASFGGAMLWFMILSLTERAGRAAEDDGKGGESSRRPVQEGG